MTTMTSRTSEDSISHCIDDWHMNTTCGIGADIPNTMRYLELLRMPFCGRGAMCIPKTSWYGHRPCKDAEDFLNKLAKPITFTEGSELYRSPSFSWR